MSDILTVGWELEQFFMSKGWKFHGSGSDFKTRDITLISPDEKYYEFLIEDVTKRIIDEAFEAGKLAGMTDIE